VSRQAFLPSIFIEGIEDQVDSLMNVLGGAPTVPASSPLDIEYSDPLLSCCRRRHGCRRSLR
jgi:hypothetical protein